MPKKNNQIAIKKGSRFVMKKVAVATPSSSRVIDVGSRVTVTTVYTVKRIDSVGEGDGPKGIVLVGVEDEKKDRVLNFRLSELKLEE